MPSCMQYLALRLPNLDVMMTRLNMFSADYSSTIVKGCREMNALIYLGGAWS